MSFAKQWDAYQSPQNAVWLRGGREVSGSWSRFILLIEFPVKMHKLHKERVQLSTGPVFGISEQQSSYAHRTPGRDVRSRVRCQFERRRALKVKAKCHNSVKTGFLCVFLSTSCLPPFHLLHEDGNPLIVRIYHTYWPTRDFQCESGLGYCCSFIWCPHPPTAGIKQSMPKTLSKWPDF